MDALLRPFVALLTLMITGEATVSGYWNYHNTTTGNFTFDPLTFNMNSLDAYPIEANMSMTTAQGGQFYNPAGFVRLATAVAESNYFNNTLVKREDLFEQILSNLLTNMNVNVSTDEVLAQAQGDSGQRAAVDPNDKLQHKSGQVKDKRNVIVDYCANGFNYVDDHIKAAARYISSSFWFQNAQWYWSGVSWITGTTSFFSRHCRYY